MCTSVESPQTPAHALLNDLKNLTPACTKVEICSASETGDTLRYHATVTGDTLRYHDTVTRDTLRYHATSELQEQAGKLQDQLADVRSKILLTNMEGNSGSNSEYLEQLFKLEQVIKLLHDGVSSQTVDTPPPVILGGRRLGGIKRKAGSKQSQKQGKKQKHSGGSHGIQLWQFILELLGDRLKRPVISWTGNGLEFRIMNSVELARLWGLRKRNPIMNFDKLSRALRYYYEKNIIKHNPMHRLVYSFCNNPDDMVYNALLTQALATCPVKQQQGPWLQNIDKTVEVTLQSIRNNGVRVTEEGASNVFPLSVNNS